jgi:hypothetical protein
MDSASNQKEVKMIITNQRNAAKSRAYQKIRDLLEDGIEDFSLEGKKRCFVLNWLDGHDATMRVEIFGWTNNE